MMLRICILMSLAVGLQAQIFTLSRDQVMKYTADNPYDRFPDGPPKVPDALLEKCKGLSIEEVWAVVKERNFNHQFAGDFKIMHPEMKLVGRAVTVQFMPMRPDLQKTSDPNTS